MKGEALTPEQLAARESLVPPPLLRLLRRLGLGRPGGGVGVEVAVAPRWASLSSAWQRHLAACLREESGSSRRYLAAAAPTQERQQGPLARLAAGAAPDAVVLLRRDATAADVLEAYCAALLLAWNARLRRGGREAGPWPAPAQLALADAKGWVAGAAAAAAPPAAPGSSASGDGGAGTCAGGSAAPNGSSFCAALASAGWALQRVALLQGPWRLAWGTELHRAE